MAVKNLTVDGLTYDVTKKLYESKLLKITYEVDDAGGNKVDIAAFTNLLHDYVANQEKQSGAKLDPQTKVGCYFSKELLLFLLSFDNCKGVIISKCFNSQINEESLAICPIDQNNMPAGTVVENKAMPDNFLGIEWGSTVTYDTMRNHFPFEEPLDFKKEDVLGNLQSYFKTFIK